jgi:hypothetical protein
MFTGETHFLLAYITEAMIPTKSGCPSHRVIYYTLEGNKHGLRTNLDFIKQSRPTAEIRNEAYSHNLIFEFSNNNNNI